MIDKNIIYLIELLGNIKYICTIIFIFSIVICLFLIVSYLATLIHTKRKDKNLKIYIKILLPILLISLIGLLFIPRRNVMYIMYLNDYIEKEININSEITNEMFSFIADDLEYQIK